MVNTVTLKELRPQLPKIVSRVDTRGDRYVVTKRGKPAIMMMSIDDYDSLMETLDIVSDKQAMKRIKQAKQEIAAGKTVSWDQLRKDIGRV